MTDAVPATPDRAKTILCVAPNGGRRAQSDHPALPLTLEALVSTAVECHAAGAAMIHFHIRDAQGVHLLDAGAYREGIAALREAVGEHMVVQITSEALGLYGPDEQMAVVRAARPEAVSLALREFLADGTTASEEAAFGDFLRDVDGMGTIPQIILYSPDEAHRLAGLVTRGVVPWRRVPVLFVLGRYGQPQSSEPSWLLPFLGREQPVFGDWMTCAFGAREAACVTAAACLGGHIRVGFENNLMTPDGAVSRDNATQIANVARTLDGLGLQRATAEDIRNRWDWARRDLSIETRA